jgi:hypothetical protein
MCKSAGPQFSNKKVTVTDKWREMCVDPEGSEAILNTGERGGPSPPGGGENGQLA